MPFVSVNIVSLLPPTVALAVWTTALELLAGVGVGCEVGVGVGAGGEAVLVLALLPHAASRTSSNKDASEANKRRLTTMILPPEKIAVLRKMAHARE